MFFKKIVLFLGLSLIYSNDLDPIYIIDKSINRLNNIDIEFESTIKYQSTINDPINYNLDFKFYWPNIDSLTCYNYIKFNSPIDYKDIEIWSLYDNDTILINKRLPIDNKITSIDKRSENTDIIKLFNFIELFNEIKDKNFSIKNTQLNDKDIFYIKAFSKKDKKKAVKIYIDQNDYSIYKIEWTDRRGRINKNIIFNNWIIIDSVKFSSKIIYEDIKSGLKITSTLKNIRFNQVNGANIKKIEAGFNFDK